MMSQPRSLAIVGYGQFGRFVHQLQQKFCPDIETVVVTSQNRDDVRVVSLAEAGQRDVVLVCVPIHRYETTLRELRPHLRADTIVVDVATVKEVTEQACRTQLADQPYICTHPMFGPASYQKSNYSIKDFRLVVTGHTLSVDVYQRLLDQVKEWGLVVIEMNAATHDRYLAETLFLTHFVSQVITVADFVRTDIDTVSFGFLMDAVESVRDDLSLFQDVYTYNQYCQATIDRLIASVETVQARLRS